MKATISVIALGFLVSACAGGTGAIPVAEIQSMSDDQIKVSYYDTISSAGDATQIAMEHCDPRGAMPAGKADAGAMPDQTVVTYNCK